MEEKLLWQEKSIYLLFISSMYLKLSSSRSKPWDKDQDACSLFGDNLRKWWWGSGLRKTGKGKKSIPGLILGGWYCGQLGLKSLESSGRECRTCLRVAPSKGWRSWRIYPPTPVRHTADPIPWPFCPSCGQTKPSKVFKQKISSVFVKKQKMWQFGDSECQGALGGSVTLCVTPSKGRSLRT